MHATRVQTVVNYIHNFLRSAVVSGLQPRGLGFDCWWELKYTCSFIFAPFHRIMNGYRVSVRGCVLHPGVNMCNGPIPTARRAL